MTKDILIQYCDLTEEIKDLRKRIQKKEDKIALIERDGVVTDSVTCGKKGKKPLGTVKITGFPTIEYSKRKTDLYTSKIKLQLQEQQCFELINEVEDYINQIDDSRIRRIFRYRYLDELKWPEVAINMGGKATMDSVRMEHDRYLAKNK